MKAKLTFWILWLGSLVLFFSHVPPSTPTGLGLDKLAHVLIFGVLTYTGIRAHGRPLLTAGGLALYAIAVEFIQKYGFPYRSFELHDIIAGLLGILIIYIFYKSSRQQ